MNDKIKSLIKKLSRFGYKVELKNKKQIDPVCGMEATSDLFQSRHNGQVYYFCSEHCKSKFDENPDEFIG